MTDKARKRRKDFAAKHNVSRRTAANRIAAAAARSQQRPVIRDAVEQLLDNLGARNTFSVLTGRVPATGMSGSFQLAAAQANRLGATALYYAETGAVKTMVPADVHEELIRRGAADDRQVQMIRSQQDQHATFSKPCRKCRRWIWCARTERQAVCVCGQTYRVTFDLAAVYHWTMRQGRLCMSCGQPERDATDASWHFVNEWQVQCRSCYERFKGASAGTP